MSRASSGTDLGTDGTDLGTDHKAVLIEALRQNPNCTYNEMSKRLSLPRRTVSREIKALQEEGRIRRVGNNRTGHWEIVNTE
jgi:ATP-dependent DNA helicase RecG